MLGRISCLSIRSKIDDQHTTHHPSLQSMVIRYTFHSIFTEILCYTKIDENSRLRRQVASDVTVCHPKFLKVLKASHHYSPNFHLIHAQSPPDHSQNKSDNLFHMMGERQEKAFPIMMPLILYTNTYQVRRSWNLFTDNVRNSP